MFKILIIFVFIFIQSIAMAVNLSGADLMLASNTALEQVSNEVDEVSLFGWQASVSETNQVKVNVLSVDDLNIGFNCNFKDETFSCTEQSSDQGNESYKRESSVTFDFMKDGNELSMVKFENAIKRVEEEFIKSSALNGVEIQKKQLWHITSYKVWTYKDDRNDNGHSLGADVWTKINFIFNGEPDVRYINCHLKGFSKKFDCHFPGPGSDIGEPNINL